MGTRKLSTCRRKRDFTKTAEPSGTLPVKRSLEPAIRKLVGSQPKRKRASADTHARA